MQHNLIDHLHCPYTGSPFELKAVLRERDSTIDFGVVTSEAGDFPIILGILRLLQDELRDPLTNLIQQGRGEAALIMALEMPFRNKWATIVNRLFRAAHRWNHRVVPLIVWPSKQHLYRWVTRSDLTFVNLAAKAKVESWTNWQTYRFSMPAFLSVYPLAHLARGCDTILDFGCGLGQSAFIMKRMSPEARLVCADYSFTSLCLAKQFFVPDAQYVCLDGNFPLPFDREYFNCVFSTDALQYIESKLGLAKEFQRVLSNEGTIVLAHLHNRLSPIKAGKALTPSGYDAIFAGIGRRMYPEDNIVADYVANGTLDLDRQWALDDMNHALSGLSLVAAKSGSAFCAYNGLWDAYIDAMRHPKLNPAYRARKLGRTWKLERGIGAPYAVERTVQDCEILPRTWRVDTESLDSTGILTLRDVDRQQLREIVRRFIMLDMPECYV
jgi:SAM-dependent methyltransferase/uncharacterized protein YbaR (Trm112 family)